VVREWRQKHKDRQRAHTMAKRAQDQGVIKRAHLCEGCGKPANLEKHHPDYFRATLVMWLCKPCHAIADKVRRVLERQSA
jgi:hypothetical protein